MTGTAALLARAIPARYRPAATRAYRALATTVRYGGWRYSCPFCGGAFRRLLPAGSRQPVYAEHRVAGAGYRLDARCPRCQSSDRERLLFLYLERAGVLAGPRRLLHVAPERNLSARLRAALGAGYLSTDLSRGRAMLCADLTAVPLADASFDVILCSHVLEHVPDDRRAMAELFRVLRPGGWALLQVPAAEALDATDEDPTVTAPVERERRFGQGDHVRLYARADYVARLRGAGFEVADRRAVDVLGPAAVARYALSRDEILFVASKERAA